MRRRRLYLARVVEIRVGARGDVRTLNTLIRVTGRGTGPQPVEDYPADVLGNTKLEDVLVAATDEQVVGFVKLGHPTPYAASQHVLMIAGLGVQSDQQGSGVGRALMLAAIQEARARGARRLTLRVLGNNQRAQALYASLGFTVEGVLHEEYLLDGTYVDDIFMALPLPDLPS